MIAHDLGGAVVLRAHLLHGCEFEQFIFVNVVAVRPWGSEFFDHVGRHSEVFAAIPPYIHAALVRAYITGAITTDIRPEALDALCQPWITQVGQGSFYRQFAQADERHTAEIEPRYGEIDIPTSIFWGESDPWIPLVRGRKLSTLLNSASFSSLPGVGHLPQIEAPEQLLKAIEPLLT